jgi:hypothetical protein
MRSRRRHFLANPFWRDPLLGAVFVLYGMVLWDATCFRQDSEGRRGVAIAFILLFVGASIILCAIVHAIRMFFREPPRPPGEST